MVSIPASGLEEFLARGRSWFTGHNLVLAVYSKGE